MNLLDRTIAWFAPQRGLQRAQARAALGVARQAYDGARGGRRTDGWVAGNTSANAENLAAGPKLMARTRDLVRNDPLLANAKRNVKLYAVGTGIELQINDKRWQALWDRFVASADASGMMDFYGLQALAAGTIFESGSILIRRRMRRGEDELPVPMQLEALEPDHLDVARDGTHDSGGWILNGIEFDAIGRRAGYWLHSVHPGETGAAFWARSATTESRFVPADSVLHSFVMDRAGQVTGVPWPHAAIIKARDLADYEDAELFRKKIEACNVGAITSPAGMLGNPLGPTPDGAPSGTGAGEAGGDPSPEYFEPGTFVKLGPGEAVSFNDPKGNTAYSAYVRTQQQVIGAAVGMPYAKLTGDLTQANFSSLKAGSNQFEALMDSFRWLTLIPQVCDPVLSWFFEAAVLSGQAPTQRLPDYEWQPPPYPEVDALKEAQARAIDVRSGVKTMQQVIRERGGDPDRQLDQIAEWNRKLDEKKITLDTDPRNVSRAGLEQPSVTRTDAKDGDSEE